NLAFAQAMLGDVRGAEDRLMAGRSASAQYNVGMLRLATGRYAEAAQAFDQAAAEQPSLAIARQRAVQPRRAALGLEPQGLPLSRPTCTTFVRRERSKMPGCLVTSSPSSY